MTFNEFRLQLQTFLARTRKLISTTECLFNPYFTKIVVTHCECLSQRTVNDYGKNVPKGTPKLSLMYHEYRLISPQERGII